MDPWTFIANDHAAIIALFVGLGPLRAGDLAEPTKRCRALRLQVLAHAAMETNVFYPALTRHQGAGRLLAEAIEDHEEVERLLDELADERTAGRRWEITLFALSALARQHFAKEEAEIILMARRVVGNANAQRRLLDRMIAERSCFIEAAGAAADSTVSPAR
jgi:hypothetical protein